MLPTYEGTPILSHEPEVCWYSGEGGESPTSTDIYTSRSRAAFLVSNQGANEKFYFKSYESDFEILERKKKKKVPYKIMLLKSDNKE